MRPLFVAAGIGMLSLIVIGLGATLQPETSGSTDAGIAFALIGVSIGAARYFNGGTVKLAEPERIELDEICDRIGARHR